MNFIFRLLLTALAAYVLARFLKPHITIDEFSTAILFVLVLGILNTILKPVFVLLTFPVTILTLGLFLIVINVLMVLLAAKLVSGIHIDGFLYALIFAFLLSVATSIIHGIVKS